MKIKIHKGMSRNHLAKKFSDWGFKIGVEVGTQAGIFSEILCKYNKGLTLYTLDAFELVYGDDYTGRIGRRKQRSLYEKAKQRLLPYNCKVIKGTSLDVLKQFKYEELDFVYIDGSHEWDYVTTDITCWGQKVKQGGVISGHDYYKPSFPDVVRAVNNYAQVHKVKLLNLTTDHTPSWWIERTW